MKRFRSIALPFGLAAIIGAGEPSHAADLVLGPPAQSGGRVYIDVMVAAGGNESIAGLQFDVAFDPNAVALNEVVLGGAADAAGKDAVYTDAFPGATRVLVMGMNQNAIADGVVATLVFEPIGDSDAGDVALERPILSDPFGNPLYTDRAKESAALGTEETATEPAEFLPNESETGAAESAAANAGVETAGAETSGLSEQPDRSDSVNESDAGSRGRGLGFDGVPGTQESVIGAEGQPRNGVSPTRRPAPRIDRDAHPVSRPRENRSVASRPARAPAASGESQPIERFYVARAETPRAGTEILSMDSTIISHATPVIVPKVEHTYEPSVTKQQPPRRMLMPWVASLVTLAVLMLVRVLVFGSRFSGAMGARR